MTFVYWIHLSEHTDILTQGYIGVSKNPKKRLYEHKFHTQNPHLQNAFKKYENIITTVLLRGEEKYCYEMEILLRPTTRIGWNINKGGEKPPLNPFKSGKNNPMSWPEHRERMRQNNPMSCPEQRERMRQNNPTFRPEVMVKITDALSKNWRVTSPQGISFQIRNLRKFCRENNLNDSHLIRVAKGTRNHHKNWKCVSIYNAT